MRIHSECLTGDALGSLRCDCRDQLEASLRTIAAQPHGVVLYLRQEGRGIGLLNKLRAYELQDHGLDTVDANLALGFRDDERDCSVAAGMLRALQIRSVRLMTTTRAGSRRCGRWASPSAPGSRIRCQPTSTTAATSRPRLRAPATSWSRRSTEPRGP